MDEPPKRPESARASTYARTPEERYAVDVNFRTLVCSLENFIHACQFTPTELREAAILAAIHYERRALRRLSEINQRIAGPCQPPID